MELPRTLICVVSTEKVFLQEDTGDSGEKITYNIQTALQRGKAHTQLTRPTGSKYNGQNQGT